jgi:hypothetical protein
MANHFELRFPILARLQDSTEACSEDKLRLFEKELASRLPEEYFQFVLIYNDSVAQHPICFQVKNPSRFVVEGSLSCTLGLCDDSTSLKNVYDFRGGLRMHEGLVPEDWLPIAYSGTDSICIALDHDNYGRVYFWDRDAAVTENDLYLVADTFTAFLAALRADDESYRYVETLPAFQAVERGLIDEVAGYLSDCGKVDLRNPSGHTLLMCAARSCWPQIVALLLRYGADVCAVDHKGWTPVVHAALGQSIDGLKLLLDAGGDPRYSDQRGRSLVELTKRRKFFRVSQFLAKRLFEEGGP